jgi:hypothetical protein
LIQLQHRRRKLQKLFEHTECVVLQSAWPQSATQEREENKN